MKFIILDRGGVINFDSDDYIKSPQEWIPIPGSIEAIARLNHAGFQIVVATNQSGLGRGYFNILTLNSMHQKMLNLINAAGGHLSGIFFCPHVPSDHCHCRKPETGLLEQIEERFSISVKHKFFVGDSFSDIQCALNGGCQPILVRTGKGEKTETQLQQPVPTYNNLSSAVDHILLNLNQ